METTHIPVETPSVNPSSQGFTLPGINSGSLWSQHSQPLGAGRIFVCFSDAFYQPLYRGFLFAAPPPSLLLNSGLAGSGPQFPMATQPFPSLTGAPGGIVPPVFPTFNVNMSTHRLRQWDRVELSPFLATGSVRPVISFTVSRTSIFSGQPSSSFLDCVVPTSCWAWF